MICCQLRVIRGFIVIVAGAILTIGLGACWNAPDGAATLALHVVGDFGSAGSAQPVPAAASSGDQTRSESSPYPEYQLTPSAYWAAFRRLSAIDLDGKQYDWFSSPTLAGSMIVDFTQDRQEKLIGDLPIDITRLARVEMQIYYLQMRFPIAGVDRTIRVYLSDDEVAGEGQHHQGDMTEINSAGQEIGWLTAPFFAVSPVRTINAGGQDENGPISVDPDTGHQRGLFGSPELWDVTHPEDAYLQTLPVGDSPYGALVGLLGNSITIHFDVSGTWSFHDVNGDGQFTPGIDTPGPDNHPDDDQFVQDTGWSPKLPKVGVSPTGSDLVFTLP